jgi:GT2 family glycosyltransferase
LTAFGARPTRDLGGEPEPGAPGGGAHPTMSVCIPATRPESLGSAIRSLRAQSRSGWEAIVLGQGDSATEEGLRAATSAAAGDDSRVRYVHLSRRGLSRARNAAFREAGGEVVAFLDDDCEADPSWLETVASAFDGDPTLGVVGGAVAPLGRVGPLSSCPTLLPAESVYDPTATPQHQPPPGWDWIGANFAIRAEVAARVGAWDIHLGAGAEFPAGEDTDYKLRLEALGVRMLTTPRSLVLHSSGTRAARAALRSQRNYAFGNGALAAKQTLSGDPRGRLWLRRTRWECLTGWLRRGRPHRLPVDLRRGLWFEMGYWRCLRHYRLDEAGLLCRVDEVSAAPEIREREPNRLAVRP